MSPVLQWYINSSTDRMSLRQICKLSDQGERTDVSSPWYNLSGLILPCELTDIASFHTLTLISISFWVKGSSAQWRVPIALQMVLALNMITLINFVSLLFLNLNLTHPIPLAP